MEAFATAFGYGVTVLVLVGGLVLSIVLWGRAPRAAGLAIGAAALELVGVIASAAWVVATPRLIDSEGLTAATIAPLQLTLSLLTTLLSVGSTGLLVGAIFTGRGRPALGGPG